ncbi:MAG: NAD-dependent epimerase/dehydratase family protein [Alphaproteobacteria bacterium]|nr:NAD-dependent epimerase/dehydratase family protein [Alphaproteobacteria bacterium]
MRIVITGGCGFLGRRLALLLLERGSALGAIEQLVLFDNAPSALPLPEDRRVRVVTGDIADGDTVRQLIAPGTHSVFHLAAVVSGQAEADTDIGYRVNLDGTRAVLEACRALGSSPRLVFASSLAVYGGTLPPAVGDDTALTPQTSYGTQKALGELLVNDYSRKGYIDGRALRLPTVVVRPGRPNRAASTFASSIIREPLTGQDAVCPVTPDTVMALASPRRVVAALAHAHDLAGDAFGASRALQLPGFSVSVGGMTEALRRAAGEAAYARIKWQPDAGIQQIVSGWPQALASPRADALGFVRDSGIDEVVQAFIEDDLPMQRQLAG